MLTLNLKRRLKASMSLCFFHQYLYFEIPHYSNWKYLKSGTKVQSNIADLNAGGIDVSQGASKLYMQGGSVINNTCSKSDGIGGVSINTSGGATYSYSSGTISGNKPINSNV